MATGLFQAFPEIFANANLSGNVPGEHGFDIDEREGIDIDQIADGDKASALPLTIRARAHTGFRNQFAYVDDFYYRIYFIPRIVDFGAVASETTRTMYVWNAYFTPVDLLGVVATNDDGLSLTPPGAFPYTFKPLSFWPFDFTADPEGPPDINAEYQFTFDNGDAFILPVVGARARLFKYPVNWARGFDVTVSFKTEIIVSRSKREQRIALRETPRKDMAFTIHATGTKRRRLDKDMALWNARPFVVAEWSRFTRTTEPIGAFETDVEMTSIPSWLIEGQKVMLVFGDIYEVRVVDSVAGNIVTFTTSGPQTFPSGIKAYKAVDAHVDASTSSQRHTNTVATAPFKFDVTPTSELSEVIPAAPVTFRDREVFTKKWNWGETVNINYEHTRETVDFGRGKIATYFPAPFNSRVTKATFLNRDNDEADDLLCFFLRMRGQQGEFYRPSYEPDLTPKVFAAITSAFMRFDTLELYDVYKDDTVFQAVYVRMENGNEQYNTIKEWGTISDGLGNDTYVEFDDPWAFDIDPSLVLMMSWMPVYRLASDSVTFQWLTDVVCNVAMSFRILEHLPAEIE